MAMTGGTIDREQGLAKVAPDIARLREILASRQEVARGKGQETFGAKLEQPQFKSDAIEAAKAVRSMMINKSEVDGADGSIPLRYRLAMSEAQGTPQAPPPPAAKLPASEEGKGL